mgnify:CR=1 FL=1
MDRLWLGLMAVAGGSVIGGRARWGLSMWLNPRHAYFFWGTFAANLVGCLVAGFVLVWLEGRGTSALLWRAFLMVGVLGGLTTYSALIVELYLLQRGNGPHWGGIYLAASLVGGMGLLWLGMRLADTLRW